MELKFDTLLVDLAERRTMGRGRAPCCKKVGLKKGPWSPAEDMRLVAYINSYGHENWRALPKQAGLLRCGKSCRLRWINYLRPDIKRGNFTQEEEEAIIKLHATLGNKWSRIAACLPGRTDNEIKNVWNTHLKKRSASKQFSPSIGESKESSHSSSPISSISDSNQGSGGIEEDEDMKIETEHPPADPLEEITKIPIEPNMDLRDILDDTDTDAINKYTASKEELSVSKGPNLSTDESKELSSPASSICSSYTTWTNLIDGNSQKEVTHPLSITRSPNDDYDMVHKEIMQDPYWKEILEIPIGPETEFWDVLEDDLCLYSSSGGDVDEQRPNQNTDPKRETTGVVDNRWIRQLENELELWMTDDDHDQNIVNSASEPLVPFSANDESVEVDFDPIIKYFQTRHLSAPTCSL